MSTKTKAARERRKKRKRQENRKLRNKAERVERSILDMGRQPRLINGSTIVSGSTITSNWEPITLSGNTIRVPT